MAFFAVQKCLKPGCITVMIPDLIEPSDEVRPYCSWICRDFFEVQERVNSNVLP